MRPGALLPVYHKTLIALIIVFAVLFFVFLFLTKKKEDIYNKVWRSLKSFSLSNAVISILILFFTYEMVPLLSSRFWFLVWGIEIAAWIYFIIKSAREIPKRREYLEREKEFKKYIP
jgi:amino acid transporter